MENELRNSIVKALRHRYGFAFISDSGSVISQAGRWCIEVQVLEQRTGLYLDGYNVCGFWNTTPVNSIMRRISLELAICEREYQQYQRETAAERAEIAERVVAFRAQRA